MSKRPALCRLCEYPVLDSGVPMSSLDAEKLSRWWRRVLDTELDDDEETIQTSLICQFCVWDARYLDEDKEDDESNDNCDWWAGHDTNQFYKSYYYDAQEIQPCKINIKHCEHIAAEESRAKKSRAVCKETVSASQPEMLTSEKFQPKIIFVSQLSKVKSQNLKLLSSLVKCQEIKCHFCLQKIKSECLALHVFEVHKDMLTAESVCCCKKNLESREELILHMQTPPTRTVPEAAHIARSIPTKCILCELTLKSRTAAFDHALEEHNVKMCACRKCGALFKSFEDRSAHFLKIHRKSVKQRHLLPSPHIGRMVKVETPLPADTDPCLTKVENLSDPTEPDDLGPYQIEFGLTDTPVGEWQSPAGDGNLSILEPQTSVAGNRDQSTEPTGKVRRRKKAKCNYCEKIFESRTAAYRHVTADHKDFELFSCNSCHMHFKTADEQKAHNLETHIRLVPCHFCDEKIGKYLLFRHLKQKHHAGVSTLRCCETVFDTLQQLIAHIQSQTKIVLESADPLISSGVASNTSALVQVAVTPVDAIASPEKPMSDILEDLLPEKESPNYEDMPMLQSSSQTTSTPTSKCDRPEPNQCFFCELAFKSKKAAFNHALLAHKSAAIFSCKQCLVFFKSPAEKSSHQVQEHYTALQCHRCKSVVGRTDFQSHLDQHLALIEFDDTECCEIVFENTEELFFHIQALSEKCFHSDKPETRGVPSHAPATVNNYVSFADKCPLCAQTFEKKRDTYHHLTEFHEVSKKLLCRKCSIVFKSARSKSTHWKSLHRNEGLVKRTKVVESEPKSVQTSFSTADTLDGQPLPKRVAGSDSPKKTCYPQPTKCVFCPLLFDSKTAAYSHVNKCHQDVEKLSCSKCTLHFKTSADRNEHNQVMHYNHIQCHLCLRFFKRPCRFHLKKHHKDLMEAIEAGVFQCCGKSFGSKRDLLVHFVRKSPNSQSQPGPVEKAPDLQGQPEQSDPVIEEDEIIEMPCSFCKEMFDSQAAAYQHGLDDHKDVQKFSCHKCLVHYKTAIERWAHERSFHPKEMQCHCCNTKIEMFYLESHVIQNHNEMFTPDNLLCCGMVFGTKEELMDHIKSLTRRSSAVIASLV